jgi:hypothetical protein
MNQHKGMKHYLYTGNNNPAWDYFHSNGKLRTISNGIICHIKHVVIAAYVTIDHYSPELITIEDNVIIGLRSKILT